MTPVTEMSMSRARRRTAGMTLIEVMVAVLILLVGIYAVVKGFPELSRTIGANKIRTERARSVQGRLDAYLSDPSILPFAVAIDPDPARSVEPASTPDDDIRNVTCDAIHVRGERFELASAGGGTSPYVLKLGLPQYDPGLPGWRVRVYEDVRLTKADTPGSLRLDEYDVSPADAAAGRVSVLPDDPTDSNPTVYRVLVVDYVWMDTDGAPHFVHHELVPYDTAGPGYYVAAMRLPGGVFAGLVPDSLRVFWRNYFVPSGGTDMDECNPDPTYGVVLRFPRPDAANRDAFGRPATSRALMVDYDLSVETPAAGDPEERTLPRRIPMMVEERQVPSAPDDWDDANGNGRIDMGEAQFCSVQLAAGYFDDGTDPLKPSPPLGIANLQILAIDLTDGTAYVHNLDGTGPIQYNDVGYRRGVVWFDPSSVPAQTGHKLRFFYRTTDDATVALYKAPAVYADCVTQPFVLPGDEYRVYIVDPASADRTWANLDKSILGFPEATAGQAVEVDYAYTDSSGRLVSVAGELHVVAGSSIDRVVAASISEPGWIVGDACTIRLDHNPAAANPGTVVEIRAVRGVSLSAYAVWRHPKGKLKTVHASTYLRTPPAA